MAFPRFIKVKNDIDKSACINLESVMSIEEVSSDPAHEDCVLVTLSNGKEFYLEVDDTELLVEYGGDKVDTAEVMMREVWQSYRNVEDDALDSPYRDRVVATLIEGETIPVVVENSGEFRD